MLHCYILNSIWVILIVSSKFDLFTSRMSTFNLLNLKHYMNNRLLCSLSLLFFLTLFHSLNLSLSPVNFISLHVHISQAISHLNDQIYKNIHVIICLIKMMILILYTLIVSISSACSALNFFEKFEKNLFFMFFLPNPNDGAETSINKSENLTYIHWTIYWFKFEWMPAW